jgi:hypothetical protein
MMSWIGWWGTRGLGVGLGRRNKSAVSLTTLGWRGAMFRRSGWLISGGGL